MVTQKCRGNPKGKAEGKSFVKRTKAQSGRDSERELSMRVNSFFVDNLLFNTPGDL